MKLYRRVETNNMRLSQFKLKHFSKLIKSREISDFRGTVLIFLGLG